MIDTKPISDGAQMRSDDDSTPKIGITYFLDLQAQTQKFETPTWRELVDRVAAMPSYPSKEACPLIKLAKFGQQRKASGCLRHDDNLEVVYGIEGDYDAGQVTVAEASQRLRGAGVEAVIYTTARHTEQGPRWRILAPLARPCSKEQRRAQVERLNHVLGGCLAPESMTPSQGFFFGRVVGVQFEHRHTAGLPIDEIELHMPMRAETAALVRSLLMPVDDGAREFQKHVQLDAMDAETMEHLASALDAIPSDEHQLWIRVGHALAFFKGTDFEAKAERLWTLYSAKSDKFDAEEALKRWGTFRAERTGYAAIFKIAQEHGWKNPKAAFVADSQALDDAIALCRKLPANELEMRWPDIAVALAPTQLPRFLDEVSHATRIPLRALNAALKAAKTEAGKAIRKASLEARAAGRQIIQYRPEDRTAHAHELEKAIVASAAPGSYLQFGGHLARVTVRPVVGTRRADAEAPPEVPQLEVLDNVGALEQAERVALFVKVTDDSSTPIGIPKEVIEVLVKKADHAAPVVSGLVSHPIVIPGSGEIVAVDGLHTGTGLYFHGAQIDGVEAFGRAEANAALRRIKEVFLEGFEFASALDEDIAIAALLTGIERKVCETAPGIAALANVQASGKTTLIRRNHLVLTGHDLPISSFPERDDAELQKRLLTMLMRAPAMVCFDNLMDGTTFRSAPLAAAMTSAVMTQRILGASKDTSCPTNVLFCITGNNLALGPDELTRWLVCRLQPAAVRPESRSFKHADVVGHALKIRQSVLRDALGIIAGYCLFGGGIAPASRFPDWDSVVRQPLMWAGGTDVAKCFSANAEASEERQAHAALVGCLHAKFGDREFHASDVAAMTHDLAFIDDSPPFDPPKFPLVAPTGDVAETFMQLSAGQLADATRSALISLRSNEPSKEGSVGRVLSAFTDTRTMIPLLSGMVSARITSRKLLGRTTYRVTI